MLLSIIAIVILGAIFFIYWRKTGGKINIGSYLLALYILSIASSLFLDTESNQYSIGASVYFLVILLLFLSPILKFNSNNIETINQVDIKLFNSISYVFIILGISTYLYFASVIINVIFSGESFLLLRTAMVGGEVYNDINLIYYILTLYCQFYPIVLVFYFYSITFTSNGKLFNRLLLFSSTAYIINVLSSVGRDGFVLWPMSYIFAFILFRNFMSQEARGRVKKLFYGLIIVFSFIFIPITVSRFYRDGDIFGTFNYVLSYFGEQFGYFNDLYNSSLPVENDFSKIFPILGRDESLTLLENNALHLRLYGIDINVFSTFIGSFYLAMDSKLLFVVALIANSILFLIFLNNRRISFGKIIFITFISQLPLHGIFYYKLSYVVSNIYMILAVLLSLLFYKRIVLRSLEETAVKNE